MFLKSLLLLSTDQIFQPDHSPLAFAREFDLFHLALAQCLDPMIQAAHDELIFDATCTQQLIHGSKLSAQGKVIDIALDGRQYRTKMLFAGDKRDLGRLATHGKSLM
jgi:hypothetical protein